MKTEEIHKITENIFVADAPCPVNLLIVCGTTHIALVEYVAQLYRMDIADTILLCGKYSYKCAGIAVENLPSPYREMSFETEADMMAQVLKDNSVPPSALVLERSSRSICENARNAADTIFQLALPSARTSALYANLLPLPARISSSRISSRLPKCWYSQ